MTQRALLLDTHVWYWLVMGDERLGKRARSHIARAAKEQRVAVSAISSYELSAKARKGKLELRPDPDEWLRRAGTQPGISMIQVDREIMARAASLPLQHGDPADRMLIATALFYDLELVTADRVILDVARQNRALQVFDAGR